MTVLSFAQFLNIGFILIFLYMRIDELGLPEWLPILQGQYNRLSVDWYEVVGLTIIFTMCI